MLWGSSSEQLPHTTADFVMERLDRSQKDTERNLSSGVECSMQSSVVPLCMTGGSGASAVEVIPQNCFLLIGQPLVLEIVSERVQITVY